MGYRGEALVDLVPPLDRGLRRFGRRAAKKVGDDLHQRVRRHTPVAKPGAAAIMASYGGSGAWIRARGGRVPGTLKESWQVGDAEVELTGSAGLRYRVPVFTFDPVAPHVEWDTMPHLILPRKPGGVLTIPTVGGMVFATLVHHPGTRGAHMMATALAEVAASWEATVREEWATEARRVWSARGAA
jgi:hypothetical protein